MNDYLSTGTVQGSFESAVSREESNRWRVTSNSELNHGRESTQTGQARTPGPTTNRSGNIQIWSTNSPVFPPGRHAATWYNNAGISFRSVLACDVNREAAGSWPNNAERWLSDRGEVSPSKVGIDQNGAEYSVSTRPRDQE